MNLSLPTICEGICPTSAYQPPSEAAIAAANSYRIFALVLAGLFIVAWVSFFTVFIIGVIRWVMFRKDAEKSKQAKKLVIIGPIGFIVTCIIFVAINVAMVALGFGR